MFDWSLVYPKRILFGQGVFAQTGEIIKAYGSRPFVVTGEHALLRQPMKGFEDTCKKLGLAPVFYTVAQEPTPAMVDDGAKLAHNAKCDCVLAIGGGSVLDTGKAVAAMVTNEGAVVDYLEGVGTGRKIENDPLPFIAVPTTAGTGAEATKNAVLSSLSEKYKKSLRDDRMMAKVAIVDPLLTLSLPPAQTAFSGMDALTQLIEAYISRKANPITDALAEYGLQKVGGSLLNAYRDGQSIQDRENVMLGALYSGICLANAGLGAAHGIAAALGAHMGIGHGLACAVLLPHVMEVNLPHCEQKLAKVGGILTAQQYKSEHDAALAGIAFVKDLNEKMSIPANLGALGVTEKMSDTLAQDSFGSSMSGNPVQLSMQEWAEKISQWI